MRNFDLCKKQSEQIRSLEEQLKNALKTKYKVGDTVYVNMADYYGGKRHPVEQEIVGIEYHYNLKNYPYLDPTEPMLFATREEAEKRLAELKGE